MGDTDVGVIDVPVNDPGDFFAGNQLLTQGVGSLHQIGQWGFQKKMQPFPGGEPFSLQGFFKQGAVEGFFFHTAKVMLLIKD